MIEEDTPLGAAIEPRPLGPSRKVSFANMNEVRRENQALEVAMVTNKPAAEVSQEIEGGSNASVIEAKGTTPDPIQVTLLSSQEAEEDPAVATEKLRQAAEKKGNMDASEGFWMESYLTADSPEYNPYMARMLRNQQIAVEVLENKFKEQEDDGFFGRAVDFVDRYVFRHVPIGMYEDITKRSERKGQELAVAQAEMGEEEYREYIQEYADELATEGFFKGDNYFAFLEGMEEATNAGYDPMANVNRVLGIAEAIPLVGSALKGGKLLTRIGSIKGPQGATKAYEAVSEATPGIHPEVQSEAMSRPYDLASSKAIKPTLGRVAEMAQNNKLVQDIQYLYRMGTFGRVATKDQISLVANKVRENVEGITSRTIADEDISLVDPLSLGDYTSLFRLGKAKEGAPYANKGNAQKYANQLQEKGLAARVIPVDEADNKKGFYVEVAERLDLTKTADPVDLTAHHNAFWGSIGRVIGSTMQMDDKYLNTLANMGESGAGAIREVVGPYLKPLEQLNLDSKATIGRIFKDLRDGEESFIREGYSDAEFSRKFRQYHPQKKKPTEQDIEAFHAAKTVSDAAYILQANKIATRYVERGFKSLELRPGMYTPGRVKRDVEPDAVVLDAELNSTFSRSEFPEDTVIWELDRELESGVTLVAKPRNVTTVRYEDVLGYNAGGRRINPDAKYFVTAGSRAILTTFSKNQAEIASKQLENIFSAARREGLSVDELSNQLDDVIAENNDWNPSIENTAQFVEEVNKRGWKLDESVSYKARDGKVEGAEDGLFAGLTMDDYVKSTNRRYDQVLMEFGGNETFNYNPIKAMVDQLSDVASEYSFRAYTQQSKTSWLKSAGFGEDLKRGKSVNELWASVDPNDLKGAKGRRLRELKAIIDRRDMVQGPAAQALSDLGESMAEWVFDGTKGKLKVNLSELDVAGSLLNLGFRSAFGFFNISQFFLQSSHAFIISAISPKHGSMAAGMVIPLRLAMASNTPAEGLKRLAKFSGLSEADMQELATYINTSGRKMIENDAIEKGTGPGWGITSWEGQNMKPGVVRKGLFQASKVVNKLDEVGLAAFNEGERLSRWTAMVTSFLEYKAKYKGASALSDSGRMWITRREQDLSFNMTTSSRGAWQSGLMKVPTQWLSYSMRAVENVALGRGFTPGERVRMAGGMALMGGTAGMFMPGVADQVGEKYGIEPTSPAFTAIQYGVFDGILSYGLQEATGEELRTAFGTRLAPLTAFTDMYRKVTEESTLTALGGPSGEIVGGGVGALFNAIGSLTSGNFESSWADMERVLRTPSGVDNIWKAATIANTGRYQSKSGTELPMEFSDFEAALQAVGITNYRVADYYGEKSRVYRDSRDLRKERTELKRDFQRALRLWRTDRTRGEQLMKEIDARIWSSGFSYKDMMSLKRSLVQDSNSEIMDLAMRMYQQDNPAAAKRIESWILEEE